MSRAVLFFCILFLALQGVNAQDSAIASRLVLVKGAFILGEPIYGQVSLQNNRAVALGIAALFEVAGHFELRSERTNSERCAGTGTVGNDHGLIAAAQIPPHGSIEHEIRLDEYCKLDTAGEYRVKFVYEESKLKPEDSNQSLWLGHAESPEAAVTITEPTGIDKQAYDFRETCWKDPDARQASRGSYCYGKMLEMYPTSTYAAWAYSGKFNKWKFDQVPSKLISLLQQPDYPPGDFVLAADGQPIPDKDGRGGYRWQTGKDWLRSLISEGEPILQVHSNDPYLGPNIRMGLALANIGIGKYETARALLDQLANSNSTTSQGREAEEYIDAMKKAKLIP